MIRIQTFFLWLDFSYHDQIFDVLDQEGLPLAIASAGVDTIVIDIAFWGSNGFFARGSRRKQRNQTHHPYYVCVVFIFLCIIGPLILRHSL